jgi:hypothetical protein
MQERILDTADRLFYGQGIRAVGVDTIAAEIGISKRTLYNAPPSERPPVEQILGNFERLERTIGTGVFRGCPFVNAVAELKEPAHAANKVALAFKEQRRKGLRDLLVQLEVEDPEGLSLQLLILIDGAIAAAIVRGNPRVATAAREAAIVLLKAAGAKVPKKG